MENVIKSLCLHLTEPHPKSKFLAIIRMKKFLLIFLLASNVLLIDGGAAEGVRTWTSTSGTELTAELVSAAGGKVVLKAAEGRVINLRLDQLSKADQEYLASLEKKKPDAAEDADAGKTDETVNIVMDPKAWYAKELGGNDAFVTEFFLKAGKSHKFELLAGGKEVYVGFASKVSSETQKPSRLKRGAINDFLLTSRSDRSEFLSSDGPSGMNWTAKTGKVRLTIENRTYADYRVMIYTRSNGKGAE
jgi:hypothetical protein